MKRKTHHIVLRYQYRKLENNLAELEEERRLSRNHGIQSIRYERWVEEEAAMSFSCPADDEAAQIAATRHFLKMIERKHGGKGNVRVLEIGRGA